jgi:hypothetical protein
MPVGTVRKFFHRLFHSPPQGEDASRGVRDYLIPLTGLEGQSSNDCAFLPPMLENVNNRKTHVDLLQPLTGQREEIDKKMFDDLLITEEGFKQVKNLQGEEITTVFRFLDEVRLSLHLHLVCYWWHNL